MLFCCCLSVGNSRKAEANVLGSVPVSFCGDAVCVSGSRGRFSC
uniref:Uncharacterized protein n=1 Tax=Anguilla anguilla TaxID=7936 RepID=A0A0E9SV71_ANGAN